MSASPQWHPFSHSFYELLEDDTFAGYTIERQRGDGFLLVDYTGPTITSTGPFPSIEQAIAACPLHATLQQQELNL